VGQELFCKRKNFFTGLFATMIQATAVLYGQRISTALNYRSNRGQAPRLTFPRNGSAEVYEQKSYFAGRVRLRAPLAFLEEGTAFFAATCS
jgi:hypothetical protein